MTSMTGKQTKRLSIGLLNFEKTGAVHKNRLLSIVKLHKKKLRKISPDFFCVICTKLKICAIYLLTNPRKCDIIELGDAFAAQGG